MKRGIVLVLALALLLVFVMGAVAMAAPGGNNNPLGALRASQGGIGSWLPAYIQALPDGTTLGDAINQWKVDNGFLGFKP